MSFDMTGSIFRNRKPYGNAVLNKASNVLTDDGKTVQTELNDIKDKITNGVLILEKKTVTATTTASGNVNLNLNISEYTVVAIAVRGRTDTMATPCTWGSQYWGAHVTGIGATMSPIASTSVTLDVYYSKNTFKEKIIAGTTTASGNINLNLPLASTMPFRIVVCDTDGNPKYDTIGIIAQWSNSYWGAHCTDISLQVLANTELIVKCYYIEL
ncbi:MAG: hypothetical protein MJZ37_07720 [Bacilli bacterium]|nr:hypothetical protein [Bacilli bacterium]